MKTFDKIVLFCMLATTSCQQVQIMPSDNEEDNARVSISANIASSSSTRTLVNDPDNTVFAKGDKIGLFMSGSNLSCWELGSEWSSTAPVYWIDLSSAVIFEAFYPYAETDDREDVPVPVLSIQDGTLTNLAQLDFLVASDTVAYNDHAGVVSFEGTHAFQHKLSLLALTLTGKYDLENAVLNSITLSATDLVKPMKYSFADDTFSDADQDLDTLTDDKSQSGNVLSTTLNHSMDKQDYTLYYMLNEVADDVTLTIRYTKENVVYNASTTLIPSQTQSGTKYVATISVSNAVISINSSTVTSWTSDELSDQIISSTPDNTAY